MNAVALVSGIVMLFGFIGLGLWLMARESGWGVVLAALGFTLLTATVIGVSLGLIAYGLGA